MGTEESAHRRKQQVCSPFHRYYNTIVRAVAATAPGGAITAGHVAMRMAAGSGALPPSTFVSKNALLLLLLFFPSLEYSLVAHLKCSKNIVGPNEDHCYTIDQ